MDKLARNKGQMLIEVVIAVGIIALVLLGVSDLMTRSARVATFQKQKDEALTIVQKKLNDYRVQRDTDPTGFYDTVAGTLPTTCVEGKVYICTVSVDKTTDTITIGVKAEWADGGQTFNVDLSETLAKDLK